ncbi:DHH family phosphoesterase [Candidatus Bathyarchaeota archaeon]|nr:MAG: DHH family phosphoesterase [Candidatus Bathyarchaeota archaeon]
MLEEMEEKLRGLMKDAAEAAEIINETVEKGETIYVISHLDADGLAAAGIIGKALTKLDATFKIRVRHWVDEKVVEEIKAENPPLTILVDLGSGYLDFLSENLADYRIIILDHHQPVGKPVKNFIHVNPHVHEVDGSKDLSGSGVAYLVAKALDESNVELATIAIVGALGDMQDKYDQKALGGLNEAIIKDAVENGYLKVEKDLIFFGRETRPIHKALALTTSPYIPGISGEEDRSLAFLASIGIKPKIGDKWRALRDLSEEEKTRLCSSLAEYLVSKGYPKEALSLVGHVYILTREEAWTPLRDGREFSVLLNATGRMDRPSLGISICMGDRKSAFEEANKVLDEYRRLITKYLGWLIENKRIEELENIYIVRGENDVDDKIIGTLASIVSTNYLDKPIIAYAAVPSERIVKVSARALDPLIEKGLNLGEIMRIAAEKCSGRGGGHNIAAGAQIPIEQVETFIKLVNMLVKEQIGKVEDRGKNSS